MSATSARAFHHVIAKINGADTTLTKAQYEAMPLRERVMLILKGEVTFFDQDGRVMPANQALMRQRT